MKIIYFLKLIYGIWFPIRHWEARLIFLVILRIEIVEERKICQDYFGIKNRRNIFF